jgi:hypothetical protein
MRGNRQRAFAYLSWLGLEISMATFNNWIYVAHFTPKDLAPMVERAIRILMDRIPRK